VAGVEPEPAPLLELEPRRGFFARLFGRRRREPAPVLAPPEHVTSAEDSSVEPTDAFAAVSRVLAPETFAGGHTTVTPWPEPAPEAARLVDTRADAAAEAPPDAPAEVEADAPPPTEIADISAEIRAAEEVAAAEVTAVLTSVLDRLGAAHHRPFSRS
jgi:hypothetical protein